MITIAFRDTGRVVQTAGRGTFRRAMSWAMGVSLFVHTYIFFGTSYFGQIILIWYLALAMIGSLAPSPREWRIVTGCRVALRRRRREQDIPHPLPAPRTTQETGGG